MRQVEIVRKIILVCRQNKDAYLFIFNKKSLMRIKKRKDSS